MYVHHDLTNNQQRYYIEQIGLHPNIMLIRMNCNASPMSDRLTNDEKLRNFHVVNLTKTFSTYLMKLRLQMTKLLISYLNSWKYS